MPVVFYFGLEVNTKQEAINGACERNIKEEQNETRMMGSCLANQHIGRLPTSHTMIPQAAA